jgi:hypothetical protein
MTFDPSDATIEKLARVSFAERRHPEIDSRIGRVAQLAEQVTLNH